MEKEAISKKLTSQTEKKSSNPSKILTILIFVVIIAIIIQIGFFSYSYFKDNSDFLNSSLEIQDKITTNADENISINTTAETITSVENQSTTNTTTATGCIPKTCEDYPERCGLLNNNCGKTLDCFLACKQGTYCYIGEAETTNICVNSTLLCRDSDNGISYKTLGTIILKGVFTDFCTSSNLTEFYCYYTGEEFQIKNETIECDNGCSGGVCL